MITATKNNTDDTRINRTNITSECSKLAQKESMTCHNSQSDWLGIVQESEIWPYEQIVCAQPRVCPGEWDTPIPLGFWDTNGSLNLSQMTKPSNNNQEKEN